MSSWIQLLAALMPGVLVLTFVGIVFFVIRTVNEEHQKDIDAKLAAAGFLTGRPRLDEYVLAERKRQKELEEARSARREE